MHLNLQAVKISFKFIHCIIDNQIQQQLYSSSMLLLCASEKTGKKTEQGFAAIVTVFLVITRSVHGEKIEIMLIVNTSLEPEFHLEFIIVKN